MKLVATLSVSLFAISAVNGQVKTATTVKVTGSKTVIIQKNTIFGTIKSVRNKPMKGVEAFVYKADSTIIASGITDSAGHYETNGVPDGAYYMKIVYPSKHVAMVQGVNVKKGGTELNVKIEMPEADTILGYNQLMPKIEIKKDMKVKKK